MYIAPEQYHDSMFDIFLTKKAKGYLSCYTTPSSQNNFKNLLFLNGPCDKCINYK